MSKASHVPTWWPQPSQTAGNFRPESTSLHVWLKRGTPRLGVVTNQINCQAQRQCCQTLGYRRLQNCASDVHDRYATLILSAGLGTTLKVI